MFPCLLRYYLPCRQQASFAWAFTLCRGLRDSSSRDVRKWKQYITQIVMTTVYRIGEGVSKPSQESKTLLKVVNCNHIKIQVKIQFITCWPTAWRNTIITYSYIVQNWNVSFRSFGVNICQYPQWSTSNLSSNYSFKSFMHVMRITQPIKKKRIAVKLFKRTIFKDTSFIWN